MNKFFTALLFLFVGTLPASAATTYYVRIDGGTATQCTGKTDASLAAGQTSKNCAFNHPFWAIAPSPAPSSKMVGGDTLVIGPGQYMMGHGAPNTTQCSTSSPWDCAMRPIPSGPDSTHPTRILGKGWDTGCASKPQLWGTQRAYRVVNIGGGDNVQIQCMDITDHSSCMEGGPDSATRCKRDVYPYGNWAVYGITAVDSSNVLIKNVSIHGLYEGIKAGRLSDWTLENVNILRNSFAGWDGDIGANVSSNSGTMTFKNTKIQFNGCGETYPGLLPHHCYSQDQGGYGDGIGTHKTGGIWIFHDSDISHNTSDGLDLLYHDGNGEVRIQRSRFEGNAGNQVKTSSATRIENSLLIGNCNYFSGKPFTATSPAKFNNCRALGNTLAYTVKKAGSDLLLYNSTVYGNGDVLIEVDGSTCNGTEGIVSRNNIFRGDLQVGGGGTERTALYYAGGSGSCPQVKLDNDYSIVFGTKSSPCPKGSLICKDPLFIGPLSGDFYNVNLQSASPGKGKASFLQNVSGFDFYNFNRGTSWDMGGLEYGTIVTKDK